MAYRRMIMVWALGSGLGCGGDSELASSAGAIDGGSTSSSVGSTSSSTGGARDVEGGDAAGATQPQEPVTTDGGHSSTGGLEEGGGAPTTFGMSDDMPLVADIPDIKHGLWGEGSWVSVEQVRPSTGPATLAENRWFYVEDPVAAEFKGLRVRVLPGDTMPPQDRWLDLVGFVSVDDDGGWQLQLEDAVEGGLHSGFRPRRVRVASLSASNAAALDDSVVDLFEPNGLVVMRRGAVLGTVLVGTSAVSGELVLVDLRPFGLDEIEPAPGTPLTRLRGVAELDGPRPVILPRTREDLVAAG